MIVITAAETETITLGLIVFLCAFETALYCHLCFLIGRIVTEMLPYICYCPILAIMMTYGFEAG
ncbi:hypothetical protein Lalb_Chr15g0086831 [Lupinus albus]|uniref:Uncharacterized protein n=1 Tax=Lupinus albus TaxID=3870 RepID=A0A6A4PDT2_LUPAL|nr:hypothetical protein Lalb_Chr15g0086831 [Lupinus albus]